MKQNVLKNTFLLFFACLTVTQAQVKERQNGWLMAFGRYALNEHWDLHAETQLRYYEIVGYPFQHLFRGELLRKVNDNLTIDAGYTYIEEFPYDEVGAPEKSFEHNMFEDIFFAHPLGALKAIHRYRIEQRWTHRISDINASFSNRFRYALTLQYPLPKSKWFFSVMDEIFIHTFKGGDLFNQNWTWAGIGRKMSEHLTVEAGYLNQYISMPWRNDFTAASNHTIRMVLAYRIK
ncbi:DUF2490 domain-containing protein [Thermonema rossianum]|uniref:DUF2490 domain-containing protein n=1 Tax=Thermonema rossianum TaxID=55505 RepID=UPI000571A927|nr:DUF2490 domain-containing protein [Thermonema rossianum]